MTLKPWHIMSSALREYSEADGPSQRIVLVTQLLSGRDTREMVPWHLKSLLDEALALRAAAVREIETLQARVAELESEREPEPAKPTPAVPSKARRGRVSLVCHSSWDGDCDKYSATVRGPCGWTRSLGITHSTGCGYEPPAQEAARP